MKIAYDGTDFCGWQIQPDVRTVQETIESALAKICKKKCPIVGAGRTDSGVHAKGQYAHFDFEINMTEQQIKAAINSNLPHDILILEIKLVSSEFHARYDAIERQYTYVIAKERSPFNTRFCSYIYRSRFDRQIIEQAIPYFLGDHDYTSFSKLNPELKHNRCIIKDIKFTETEETVTIQISANRFLHNMVRRIVGTLVNLCITDSNPNIIAELIERENPTHKLIVTAPPNGLFLEEVIYP